MVAPPLEPSPTPCMSTTMDRPPAYLIPTRGHSRLTSPPLSPPPSLPRSPLTRAPPGGRARRCRTLLPRQSMTTLRRKQRSTTATPCLSPSLPSLHRIVLPIIPATHPRPFFPCSGSTRGARRQGDHPELGGRTAAVDRDLPSTHESARHLPRASAPCRRRLRSLLSP